MGLDMYLTKKVYVGANWEHNNVKGKIELEANGKPIKINFNRVSYIEEEVCYWRKANAIHQWFVNNVQDGDDDCGNYYLEKTKLKELLKICRKVLKSSKLVDGVVQNGSSCSKETGHKLVPNWETGKTIENPETAKELLPIQDGFFFGGTDYDQWYHEDIKYTAKTLEKELAEVDEKYPEYYYHSSW